LGALVGRRLAGLRGSMGNSEEKTNNSEQQNSTGPGIRGCCHIPPHTIELLQCLPVNKAHGSSESLCALFAMSNRTSVQHALNGQYCTLFKSPKVSQMSAFNSDFIGINLLEPHRKKIICRHSGTVLCAASQSAVSGITWRYRGEERRGEERKESESMKKIKRRAIVEDLAYL
jgi:hypothetical protein